MPSDSRVWAPFSSLEEAIQHAWVVDNGITQSQHDRTKMMLDTPGFDVKKMVSWKTLMTSQSCLPAKPLLLTRMPTTDGAIADVLTFNPAEILHRWLLNSTLYGQLMPPLLTHTEDRSMEPVVGEPHQSRFMRTSPQFGPVEFTNSRGHVIRLGDTVLAAMGAGPPQLMQLEGRYWSTHAMSRESLLFSACRLSPLSEFPGVERHGGQIDSTLQLPVGWTVDHEYVLHEQELFGFQLDDLHPFGHIVGMLDARVDIGDAGAVLNFFSAPVAPDFLCRWVLRRGHLYPRRVVPTHPVHQSPHLTNFQIPAPTVLPYVTVALNIFEDDTVLNGQSTGHCTMRLINVKDARERDKRSNMATVYYNRTGMFCGVRLVKFGIVMGIALMHGATNDFCCSRPPQTWTTWT